MLGHDVSPNTEKLLCVNPNTEKLLTIATCWQRENQFPSMQCHWVYQPHSRAGLLPSSSWLTQNRLHSSSLCVCVLFYWFLFVLIFNFCLVCFEREERRREREGEKLEREVWRISSRKSWGERKTQSEYIKIVLYKRKIKLGSGDTHL